MDSGLVELVEDGGEVEEVPAWSLPLFMCMKDEPGEKRRDPELQNTGVSPLRPPACGRDDGVWVRMAWGLSGVYVAAEVWEENKSAEVSAWTGES